MKLRRLLPLLFICLPLAGWTQIVLQGLPHYKNQKSIPSKNISRANARGGPIKADTITLPFWEDFATTRTTYADTNRWQHGRSIRVNDGMAINPPSIKTATFDGIDSLGKPYSVTDILAKGYADKLVSQPIDLSLVPPGERNTVWFSYMYQMKGNGETPDDGDRLEVLFFNKNAVWVPVDTINNEGSLEPDVFYSSTVQVNDEQFFHPGFRIRIQNYARLSGPYDTWHVDYIYLNKNRIEGSEWFNSFPDRTVSAPPTSLFGVYTSIPLDHFLLKADSILTQPVVIATNRNVGQTKPPGSLGGQPMQYYSTARMGYRLDGATTSLPTYGPVVGDTVEGRGVGYNEFVAFNVSKIPGFDDAQEEFDNLATLPDSLGIQLEIGFNTKDNVPPGPEQGDFREEFFGGLDFRRNDTTYVNYTLANKYQYDDGVPEYGAGLNQPGAQLAYQFQLVGVKEEDINYLEMMFPRFGDELTHTIELRVWNKLGSPPIYTEKVTLERSSGEIWRRKLTQPVHVRDTFYIGWKQDAAAIIAIGLDKSNNTGDRMWYNTNGSWMQNTLVNGSLMLRPVFGAAGDSPNNGLEDERYLAVYPNPSSGVFYFDGIAQMISVYDITGRRIQVTTETASNQTKIELSNVSTGIYIIKAHVEGRVKAAKVLVK